MTSGVVVRSLRRSDPRWVVPLLVPFLLAAGTLPPEAVRRGAAAAPQRPTVLPFPARAPEVPATPHRAAVEAVRPALPPAVADAETARVRVRAGRSSTRRRGPLTAEQRGRATLAALPYDVTALGYGFRFEPYRGGGVLGTTNRRTRLITVHVPRSDLALRATLAHEIGHALDFEHGTAERRDAYRRIRALPPGPWFPCDRCDDLRSPAGDFAEVFAVWLVGPGDFRSRLQGPPDEAQLRELHRLFRLPASPMRARMTTPTPAPSPRRTGEPGPGLPALLEPAASPSPSRG